MDSHRPTVPGMPPTTQAGPRAHSFGCPVQSHQPIACRHEASRSRGAGHRRNRLEDTACTCGSRQRWQMIAAGIDRAALRSNAHRLHGIGLLWVGLSRFHRVRFRRTARRRRQAKPGPPGEKCPGPLTEIRAMLDPREAMLATRTYGVLTGRVKAGRLDPAGTSSHDQIWIDAGVSYRIAVNVRSVDKSEVL